MAVYVDPIRHYPGLAAHLPVQHWCHMTADTEEELHAMAAAVGMPRRVFQMHPYRWHYDLTEPRRTEAVKMGALEITSRQMIRIMRARVGK